MNEFKNLKAFMLSLPPVETTTDHYFLHHMDKFQVWQCELRMSDHFGTMIVSKGHYTSDALDGPFWDSRLRLDFINDDILRLTPETKAWSSGAEALDRKRCNELCGEVLKNFQPQA